MKELPPAPTDGGVKTSSSNDLLLSSLSSEMRPTTQSFRIDVNPIKLIRLLFQSKISKFNISLYHVMSSYNWKFHLFWLSFHSVQLPDARFPFEFFDYSSNVSFILLWRGWRKGVWNSDEIVNFRPFLIFDRCYIIISTTQRRWIKHYISLKNIFSVVIDFTTSWYTSILRVIGICKVFICKLTSNVIVGIFNLNHKRKISYHLLLESLPSNCVWTYIL